ncbi:mediator complex subunit 4 [Tachypleus tridentatus]|uniref:mediator complex subunit 4 n=1 Tax=Tachypleus tridentatus TaxID=6853 RepID=UPI003FD1EFF4
MTLPGTKEKLLQLVDDVEIIAKELFENIIAHKPQKLPAIEHAQLADLLVTKDQELKDMLKTASEQAEIQKKMDAVQGEVDKQDQDIRTLQKHLKEAEHILATAIYQAKQKLQSIQRSNERSTPSEELIKYAHRISASNAVAAPHNWQQGDPRRPYPTDIEMRSGFLGRMSDLPLSSSVLQQQQQGNLGDLTSRGPHGDQPQPTSHTSSFTWQGATEMKPGLSSTATHNSVNMESKGHSKENEDVEVLSTDSSSSSSSDSQ